ncbi:MAG: UDP-N-acetylmuramate--L-alanine ligase [Ilumatobacteraceae bacterium]
MTSHDLDLSSRRRIHVVGVGGPGMSAIAIVLAQMGHDVSGSDVREVATLDSVRGSGVRVSIGHDPAAIEGCDIVTASTAIRETNVELDAARRRGIRVASRGDVLAAMCSLATTVAVAGTHGKTTSSSVLRAMLAPSFDPSFLIGGNVIDLGVGARWTGSSLFVVEADESDGTHRRLPVGAAIVTNVDQDHLDHFGDFDSVVRSFAEFVQDVAGPVVLCADDPHLVSMQAARRLTYGSTSGDVCWSDVTFVDGRTSFTVRGSVLGSEFERRVTVPLRGEHNVSNVTGCLTLAVALGVDVDEAIASISDFGGVGRRFDVRAEIDGITLIDDYAHLPREIDAVLAAARSSEAGRRLVAVFQPNRYNRMATMWPDYAACFEDADVVVIADIYSSGTDPIPGVTGRLVADAVAATRDAGSVHYVENRHELAGAVSALLTSGDVCVSMGCGDVEFLPDEIVAVRHSV